MRMLDLDVNNVKELSVISREEAFEFVKESMAIICQTNPRNFYEIPNISDLQSVTRLEEQGVYSTLKFYIS